MSTQTLSQAQSTCFLILSLVDLLRLGVQSCATHYGNPTSSLSSFMDILTWYVGTWWHISFQSWSKVAVDRSTFLQASAKFATCDQRKIRSGVCMLQSKSVHCHCLWAVTTIFSCASTASCIQEPTHDWSVIRGWLILEGTLLVHHFQASKPVRSFMSVGLCRLRSLRLNYTRITQHGIQTHCLGIPLEYNMKQAPKGL